MSAGPDGGDWPVSFEAAAEAHLDDWLAASPAERLAWLEEAIELAYATGALPRPGDDDAPAPRG